MTRRVQTQLTEEQAQEWRARMWGLRDIEVEIVVRDGRDLFTDERRDIARITYALGTRRYVLLAARGDGDWFPTWLGEDGSSESCQLPRGFVMPVEFVKALAAVSAGSPETREM